MILLWVGDEGWQFERRVGREFRNLGLSRENVRDEQSWYSERKEGGSVLLSYSDSRDDTSKIAEI
jgi:hypothetical protein